MFEDIENNERKLEANEQEKETLEKSRQKVQNAIEKLEKDCEVAEKLELNLGKKNEELAELDKKKEELSQQTGMLLEELDSRMRDTQNDLAVLSELDEEDQEALEIANEELDWIQSCQNKIRQLNEKYQLNLSSSSITINNTSFIRIERHENTVEYTSHALTEEYHVNVTVNEDKFNLEDYKEQLYDFESGLNSLTVYDFIQNYEQVDQEGRADSIYQSQYRQAVQEQIIEELQQENPDLSYTQAFEIAKEQTKELDALHLPDQGLGGFGQIVHALGDRGINRSIGYHLTRSQREEIYRNIKKQSLEMSIEEQKSTYLNITLHARGARK